MIVSDQVPSFRNFRIVPNDDILYFSLVVMFFSPLPGFVVMFHSNDHIAFFV